MNPILALIIANIIWGAAAPIFKYSLTNIPPFTLAFLRFFIAALIFLPFIWRFNFRSLNRREWTKTILASFFGITINISFFFMGLQRADSINAPIIASSGPLFLFLLAVFFLHEKIKYRTLFGMFFSLLGVLVIVFLPILVEGKSMGKSAFEGNVMYIIATLGAVLHPLLLKNELKKLSPYPIIFIGFIFASFTFAPFMFNELQLWSFSSLNSAGITGIIFGALFSSALAYFLFFYGLSKIAAQEVGIFTYIDPVVAILIAIPLVHEYPTLYFLIGSVLVFGGIYISEGRLHYHPFHRLRS
ncbi:MAG: DMT family transporter [Candidatus Roizmanbacteria bacterium]|nr:MAG: DMT family transporter [Candidatus Roizmanbacteria bacterium]